MNKKLLSIISFGGLLLSPGIILAAFDAGRRPEPNLNAGNQWLTNLITAILSSIWMLFIAFAIIMFLVAGFQFLKAQGEPGEVATARKSLLWGMVGVLVGVLAFLLPFIIRYWIF